MQKSIGAVLGVILVRVVLPMLFGPAGMVYFCLFVFAVVLACAALYINGILKMRRLRRKNCDDALLYARKKRRAFDEPDFSDGELREVRRARKRGDSRAVQSVIASANKRLSDKKQEAERSASAKARAQREAELRRPGEIGLYRA